MATSFESPAMYERDFRSAKQEWKRGKTLSEKWSRGASPSPGVRLDIITGEPISGSEGQQAKVRPRSKYCDMGHHTKRTQNLVKMRRNWDLPDGRVRTKLYAKSEINDASRSVSELPPITPLVRRPSATDNILYSFDRLDTPGRPLTLDIFVKAETARDMEKFVEKEYEILDVNGEALKGRKARHHLRQAHSDLGTQAATEILEDEGFELL